MKVEKNSKMKYIFVQLKKNYTKHFFGGYFLTMGRKSKYFFEILPTLSKILFKVLSHLQLGCANKDLDRSLGFLGKFIDYCRIVALLPVIPYTQRNN